jgi:rhamnose utilization protein RhaD (predicted bifunctional aldolase and dehydrogenase)
MSEAERLVYRSNILGSDKRVTNYGGGNTSSKIWQKDPLTGEKVEVLWVKGSGGDSASIKLDGFATLYMEKLRALKLYRGLEHEDEMVGYLLHCTFNLNPRAASIDTPLHAYVPKPYVDHMHPDAIIAIAAARDSKALTQEIFGDEIGWLPWKRPGFELGPLAGEVLPGKPESERRRAGKPRPVHLGRHAEGMLRNDNRDHQQGDRLVREGDEGQACLRRDCRESAEAGGAPRRIAARLMPKIRGMISGKSYKVGHFDDSAAVLDSSIRRTCGRWRRSAPPARPFPAHQDPPAGHRLRSRQA